MTKGVGTMFVGLDLDYCAFETGVFYYDNVLPLLAKTFPDKFNQKKFLEGADKFRRTFGSANDYDFFGHIQSIGLDVDRVEGIVIETFGNSGNRFLRPGVEQFLDVQASKASDLYLITLGSERLQRMKAVCGGVLSTLKMHAILEPKGAFIAKTFPDRQGYHIDDTTVGNLPEAIHFVQVVSHKSASGDIRSKNHFEDFNDLLQRGPKELVTI